MVKSRLIALLSKFTIKELKEFEKFVSSPYFSKGRDLKPLFTQLKRYYPDFSSPELNVETIFKKLFPGKKFDRKKSSHAMQVLISELLLLAEKFLVHNSLSSPARSYQFNSILAESYREKDLMGPVLKILLKNSEQLSIEETTFDHYTKRLETNMSVSGVYYTLNKSKESYEFSRKNLLYIYAYIFDIMNKFTNDYFVNRYTYNYQYSGFELIKAFVESFDPELFDAKCEKDEFETKSVTLLNYYMLKSRLDENDIESLTRIFAIYSDIFDNLSRHSQWFIFALLFNRLYGRIRFDTFYLHKANELIDFVFGKKIFSTHENINLHLGSYHSALMVKAALSNSSDLADFINDYCNKTDPEYHDSLSEYSNAMLNFKNSMYGDALKKVSQKDILNFPQIKINKHKVKICSLFELSYFEEAILSIDSFEHFLRKNKNVSEIVKTENLKFVSGMKKLLKIRLGDYSEPDFELNKIIEMNRNSLFGYWFEEKSGQINKK